MENILLSIVVPIKDYDTHTIHFLESISKQKENCELICVVNESVLDDVKAKVRNCGIDAKIKVQNEEAPYAAGLDEAVGEYVYFSVPQDFFADDFMTELKAHLAHSREELVLLDMSLFDNKTAQMSKYENLLSDESEGENQKFGFADFFIWNKIIKREVVEREWLRTIDTFSGLAIGLLAHLVFDGMHKSHLKGGGSVYHRTNYNDGNSQTNLLVQYEALQEIWDYMNEHSLASRFSNAFYEMFFKELARLIQQETNVKNRLSLGELLEQSNIIDEQDIPQYKELVNEECITVVFGTIAAWRFYKRRNVDYSARPFECIKEAECEEVPCVSVIIPIYNVENYVKETLDSILGQTLKNIEVICINDGSPDNSLAIVTEVAQQDKRVALYTQKNCGLSVSRNRGLSVAKGKYVYFMDSDDFLDTEALEVLYNQAEANELDVVYFNTASFAESSDCETEANRQSQYYKRHLNYSKDSYSGAELMRLMYRNDDIRVSACFQLTRRALLIDAGFKFRPSIIHEDNSFAFITMLTAKRVGYCEYEFYKRRVRSASITTTKVSIENAYGMFACFLDVQEFFKKHPVAEEDYLLAVEVANKFMLLGSYYRFRNLKPWEKRIADGMNFSERLLFTELVEKHSIA